MTNVIKWIRIGIVGAFAGMIITFWITTPAPDFKLPDFHQDIPVVRIDPYINPPKSPDEALPPGDWGTEFTAEDVTIIGFGGGGGGSCGFYPYKGLDSVYLGDPLWNNVFPNCSTWRQLNNIVRPLLEKLDDPIVKDVLTRFFNKIMGVTP